jgi:hypothetical protein
VSTHITNFGPVKDLFTGAASRTAAASVWGGQISLGAIASERAGHHKKIDAYAAHLDAYYVGVDFTAPTRCIDGRLSESYANGTRSLERGLGPQVAGGTPAGALVHRIILMGEPDGHEAFSFNQDVSDIITIFEAHGLGFGGHIDEAHDTADEDTGCGAIDQMPQILQKMVDPKAWTQLHGMAKHLLGDAYSEAMVNQVSGRLLRLEAVADDYLKRNRQTGRYGYKQQVIKVMRLEADKGEKPVERLTGAHHEKAIVVNTIPGTTFDRDRFTTDFGPDMQLFNWDIWRSHQSAVILYPISTEMSFAEAKNMLRRRYEYVLCRTLYSLATTMVLTDGTLPLLVRE